MTQGIFNGKQRERLAPTYWMTAQFLRVPAEIVSYDYDLPREMRLPSKSLPLIRQIQAPGPQKVVPNFNSCADEAGELEKSP